MTHRPGWPLGGRPAAIAAGALAAMVWTATAATPALAYVQYQTVNSSTGAPVYFHWAQSCIPITVYPNDLTDMPTTETEAAATLAAAAWSRDMLPCTYLDIQVTKSLDQTHPAGSDSHHVLVFRSPWCNPSDPPGSCQTEALAVTSVFAGKTSGKIQDADIEVNTEFFAWGDLVARPEDGKQDLQNALTHEMGHLVGLDHNCFSAGIDPVTGLPLVRQIDNTGAPVPDCFSAPPLVRQATMFNSADVGDLSKRTLEPDDKQAMCDIYPVAQDPNVCSAGGLGSQGCSCALGSGAGPRPGLELGLLPASLLALVGLSRSRSRGRALARAR